MSKMRRWPALGLAALLLLGSPLVARAATPAAGQPPPVPDIACDAGAHPEHMQGRVSAQDVADGYAASGYRCNTTFVSQYSNVGGFRVQRYADHAGHVCAYYDTTVLFPLNVLTGSTHGAGVFVLDMTDPAHPVHTATLTTPAMLSPHESLSLNTTRGLLAADLGNPAYYPAWVDIYDLSKDCRHPVLQSSLPIGLFGHEGAFSPDGRTFWVTSAGGSTMTAIDISDPRHPKSLWTQFGTAVHGLNISDDGNTVYEADLGSWHSAGLDIVDVTGIQHRVPGATGHLLAHLSWPDVSLPQVPLPITISGHPYLFEVDEFATEGTSGGFPSGGGDSKAHAGAARIIDIADAHHPKVVSNVRLAADLTVNRPALAQDPGANSPVGGYASHYCAVPRRADPGVVACSFIASGLRVFDIHDPLHPKEIAYFNAPVRSRGGNGALSAPAFDPIHGQIWYSDSNEGFFAVQLTSSALAYWSRP